MIYKYNKKKLFKLLILKFNNNGLESYEIKETIVMNIADNIYNIAGVLNAQVVSMEEANRLQQDRAFKNAAAAEEATSEALKVSAPAPAAAPEKDTKDKKGGITDLIESVLSTKKIFKGFLKKFAIFAAGITAVGLAGFAASTFMSDNDEEDPKASNANGAPPAGPNEPQVISSTPPGGAMGGAPPTGAPVATGTQTTTPENATAPANPPTAASSKPAPTSAPGPSVSGPALSVAPSAPAQMSVQSENAPQLNKATAGAATGMMGVSLPELIRKSTAAVAPAAAPAAPPPSVVATASTNTQEYAKLDEYFDRPENASEKAQMEQTRSSRTAIERAIVSTKYLIQNAKTPEEKADHEDILNDQLEPGLKAIKVQQKTIVDKARKAIQQTTSGVSAPQSSGAGEAVAISPGGGSGGSTPGVSPAAGGGASGGAPSATPTGGGRGAPSATPTGGGGGASGIAPSATPTGGGGASPVPASPSSGASIGAASTAVSAASENAPPKVSSTQINNDTTSGDEPAPTPIPSPIAGRGSLDVGTFFGSGS